MCRRRGNALYDPGRTPAARPDPAFAPGAMAPLAPDVCCGPSAAYAHTALSASATHLTLPLRFVWHVLFRRRSPHSTPQATTPSPSRS